MKYLLYSLTIFTVVLGCSKDKQKLPILGHAIITNGDTSYPTIQPFTFINQDSLPVTLASFENKIYVADFIFLSCPTICPKMTKEMKKVYDAYETNPRVSFISHSIDPVRDTVARLKQYSEALGIDGSKWHFVTGDKYRIYSIAEESYFSSAFPDEQAPGGFIHSGNLLLVGVDRHIRGVYNGTDSTETERLIKDIKILLAEQFEPDQENLSK